LADVLVRVLLTPGHHPARRAEGVPVVFEPHEGEACDMAGVHDPDGNLLGRHC